MRKRNDRLIQLTSDSVDPNGWGCVNRDEEYRQLLCTPLDELYRIVELRNQQGKPTRRLRSAIDEKLGEEELGEEE